jgi:hypothetical protein
MVETVLKSATRTDERCEASGAHLAKATSVGA